MKAPSELMKMPPHKRKAAIEGARIRQKVEAAMAIEKKNSGYPQLPVHFGDLTGQQGNTFAVMNQVIGSVQQFRRCDLPVRPAIESLLQDWFTMSYDDIVATLRQHCEDLDGSWDALDQHMEALAEEAESDV